MHKTRCAGVTGQAVGMEFALHPFPRAHLHGHRVNCLPREAGHVLRHISDHGCRTPKRLGGNGRAGQQHVGPRGERRVHNAYGTSQEAGVCMHCSCDPCTKARGSCRASYATLPMVLLDSTRPRTPSSSSSPDSSPSISAHTARIGQAGSGCSGSPAAAHGGSAAAPLAGGTQHAACGRGRVVAPVLLGQLASATAAPVRCPETGIISLFPAHL